jgi:VIT family
MPEPEPADQPLRERILDPVDRISEVLFGLFMVLTFTGTLSVATAGREDVRTMLISAIGCNIAWGFVDAVMYVLRNLVTRGHRASFLGAVQSAKRPQEAYRLIAAERGALAESLDGQALEQVRAWICARPAASTQAPRLLATDLLGALGVFLLVVASTFPPVLPFVFVADLWLAMRLSAAIAIAMLFVSGYAWGRYAGMRPVRVGLVMVLLGGITEAVVIALGG